MPDTADTVLLWQVGTRPFYESEMNWVPPLIVLMKSPPEGSDGHPVLTKRGILTLCYFTKKDCGERNKSVGFARFVWMGRVNNGEVLGPTA